MSLIGWKHSIDEAGSYEGSSDAGIETFKGDPITNFAREGVQNSLDAARKLKNLEKDKVRIELSLIRVCKKSIPNIVELENNMNSAYQCFQKWFPNNADPKTHGFYKKVFASLQEEDIPVFQFVDSNTKGMNYTIGEKENRLYKFLKGKGTSGKEAGSGGSFGIGKSASLAVSDLRTIFVSTVFKENNGSTGELTQGKCQITSFEENNNHRVGTGYWGVENGCEPVKTSIDIPDWIRFNGDSTTGTKLSILGFNKDYQEFWEEKMSLSIVANYFSSIISEKLEVLVGDKYHWNQNSLTKTLSNDLFKKKIENIHLLGNASSLQILNNTKEYVTTYTNSEKDVQTFKEHIDGLGICSLKIRVAEGMPSKVCFLRDGMKITDDLKGNGITRFTGLKDFVAIFECLDKEGNAILRSTENPSHNNFEPSRIDLTSERIKAEKSLQNIGSWVREKLNQSCKEDTVSVRDIETLMDFFSYEDRGNSDSQESDNIDEINPFGVENIVVFPVIPLKPHNPRPQVNPIPHPNPNPDPSPNPDPDPSPNPDPDPDHLPKKKNVQVINPRVVRSVGTKLTVAFSTNIDSDSHLIFYASGEDIDERIFPKKINGKRYAKDLTIQTLKNKRTVLDLEFSEETNYAIIIKAYEISY